MEISTSSAEKLEEFLVAERYFSDTLNAQLVIFSIIIAAIVALYFFFNYKISKKWISSGVNEYGDNLKKELLSELNGRIEAIETEMKIKLEQNESALFSLRGQIHRTLGQFWDSEHNFAVAFMWWIRAASDFVEAKDVTLVRIALESAKKSVKNTPYAHELTPEWIGEYQAIVNGIDTISYGIEKELLDREVKKLLGREASPVLPLTPRS